MVKNYSMAEVLDDKPKLQKAYEALLGAGYELPDTYEVFAKEYGNDEGYKKIQKGLINEGFETPTDFGEFKTYIIEAPAVDAGKKKDSTVSSSDGGSSGLPKIKFGGDEYEVNPTTQEVFKGGKPVTVPAHIKDYIEKNIIGSKPKDKPADKPYVAKGAVILPEDYFDKKAMPKETAWLISDLTGMDMTALQNSPQVVDDAFKDLSTYTGITVDKTSKPETITKAIGQAKMLRDTKEFAKLAKDAGVTEKKALDIAYDNAADKFLDGGDKELWALTKQVNQAFDGGDKATVDKLMPVWEKARKQFIDTRHDKITSLHNMIITGKNVDGLPLTSAAIEDLKKEKNLLTKQLNGFFKSPEAVVNDIVADTPMLSVFDKMLKDKTGQQKLETIAKPMLARYFLLGKKMGVKTEDVMGEGNTRFMQTDKTYLDDIKNYMGIGDYDGEVTSNDRKEFNDLHNKLGIIMPMLLINKIPVQDVEDKPVDILKKGAMSMTPALATMNQTGQQKANTLNDILALANISPDDLTQDALSSINTKMKKYGWAQDLAQMGGSTLSIMLPMMLAETGAGFAIESLALNPRTAMVANFLIKNPIGKVIKGGTTFSAAGKISDGEELDFGTGAASGFVDVVLDALGSRNKTIAKWFINTFGKQATKYAAIAAKPLAKGTGEFFQESGETIYQAWRDTPEGKSVMDTLQQQFPDADSQLKFFVGTVIMGGGLGLAGDIGFSGAKKRAYDALSPENKAKADAFMGAQDQKAKDAVDEVVPVASNDAIEKNIKDAGEAKQKLQDIAKDVQSEDEVVTFSVEVDGVTYSGSTLQDLQRDIDFLDHVENTANDELYKRNTGQTQTPPIEPSAVDTEPTGGEAVGVEGVETTPETTVTETTEILPQGGEVKEVVSDTQVSDEDLDSYYTALEEDKKNVIEGARKDFGLKGGETIPYKNAAIHATVGSRLAPREYGGNISKESFERFADPKLLIGNSKDAIYLRKMLGVNDSLDKGMSRKVTKELDTLADEISEKSGVEITPQDIVEYLLDRSKRPEAYLKAPNKIAKTAQRITDTDSKFSSDLETLGTLGTFAEDFDINDPTIQPELEFLFDKPDLDNLKEYIAYLNLPENGIKKAEVQARLQGVREFDNVVRGGEQVESGAGGEKATPAEKVEAEPTADINNVSDKAGIVPKNLRDLYDINRTLFGLNKVKSLAAAVAMDRMVGVMAKRAGIAKGEMYARLEFKKDTEANVLKADNALFQGIVNGENVTLRNTDVDVVNGFYSPLRKIIAEAKQDKMPAKQWIEKFARGEEAKWTGLTDWLAAQQGSVSKQDILDYLKNNRVNIVEVVKGSKDAGGKSKQEKLQEIKEEFDNNEYGYVLTTDMSGDVVVEDSEGEYVDDVLEDTRLQELAEKYYELNETSNDDTDGDTKFSQYQLEGDKSNYKEVLVTLPEKQYDYSRQELAKAYTNYKGGEFDLDEFEALVDGKKPELMDILKKGYLQAARKTDNQFKSSHFDEPNILVHLRMNTRTDAEGNKVLFLEEIQSDWGQKGKKEGFSTAPTKSYVIKGSNGEILAEAPTKEGLEDIFDYYKQDDVGAKIEELISTNRPLSGDSKTIPTAPFVTDTNAWVKLGLKVAMKEAVAQGATKIAWTTGEQQNDRYDLSKQVDKIDVEAVEDVDNLFFVDISLSNGTTENLEVENGIIREGNYKGQRLDNVIGKDYADKILSTPKGESVTLQGADLKVGGKGMKGFYGSPTEGSLGIVGNAAKSLFKQDIGTVEFKTKGKQEYTVGKTTEDVKIFSKRGDSFTYNGEPITKQRAFEIVERGGQFEAWSKSDTTQNSITITPELRTQVQNGLALFQKQQGQNAKGAMVAADGKFIIYAISDPNVSTPLHEVAHVFEHYLTDSERATVNNWAKTGAWTTETSEKFARGFEKYLSEGIAPTEGLKKVFEKFKTWLADIYNGIKGSDIDIELNDDMRSIYTQMLGKDAVPTKKTKATPALPAETIDKLLAKGQASRTAKQALPTETIKETAAVILKDNDIEAIFQEDTDESLAVLMKLQEKLGIKKIC